MKSRYKKVVFYSLFLINLIIIFTFWRHGSASMFALGAGSSFIALGRISGLIAVYLILFQLMLIGRVRWLESVFGLDKLSIIHKWNGYVALGFMVIHPIFLTLGYGMLSHTGLVHQFLTFILTYKYVWMSLIAIILFALIIVLSITIARKRLKYETWYYIHIFVYGAILLAYFHQLAVGGDFIQLPFVAYWKLLYIFVVINLLFYRFAKPLFNYAKHKFVVEKIVRETDSAVSVYITGKSMEEFSVKAGQFIIVRFLSKKFGWQAHPFSISGIYENGVRITIKGLGDYTKEIHNVKIGTHVLIDGPYGIFTTEKTHRKRFLFIAGGVGITPIKSMLEECKKNEWDAVLLYANKKKSDVIFPEEISHIMRSYGKLRAYLILSEPDTDWRGAQGRIDEEKLHRLVSDFRNREIYLCGPVPMMKSTILLLHSIGIKDKNMHYERFSL